MTNDEIRIKVAESFPPKEPHWWCPQCGKVESTHVTYEEQHGIDSCMERVIWVEAPNYPEDLNACAEFEETLTDEEWPEYTIRLSGEEMGEGWPTCFLNLEAVKLVASATARQRCLAYLKTKGILP